MKGFIMDMVTKTVRVVGVLFFGYISLSTIGSIFVLQKEPDTPIGMITAMFAIGIASGYITRLLWRQLRAEKSITMAERLQKVKDSPIIKSVRSNLSVSAVKPTVDTTIDDEAVYNQIADELAEGVKKEGLWLKALEQANGDESKTLPAYIKYRSQVILAEQERLKDEEKTRIEEERLAHYNSPEEQGKRLKSAQEQRKKANRRMGYIIINTIVGFFIFVFILKLLGY